MKKAIIILVIAILCVIADYQYAKWKHGQGIYKSVNIRLVAKGKTRVTYCSQGILLKYVARKEFKSER